MCAQLLYIMTKSFLIVNIFISDYGIQIIIHIHENFITQIIYDINFIVTR
jgi:hypothetical protein